MKRVVRILGELVGLTALLSMLAYQVELGRDAATRAETPQPPSPLGRRRGLGRRGLPSGTGRMPTLVSKTATGKVPTACGFAACCAKRLCLFVARHYRPPT